MTQHKEEDNSKMRISREGIQKTKDLLGTCACVVLPTCVVLGSQNDTIHLLHVLRYKKYVARTAIIYSLV